MTDRDADAAVDGTEEARPADTKEAAEIVQNDPALNIPSGDAADDRDPDDGR